MSGQPRDARLDLPFAFDRGTQVTTRGGVEVVTSPDGRSTTVTDRGRVTTITTSPDGRMSVLVDGRTVTDAKAVNDAISRLATSTQSWREPTFRVNGRPLSERDLLAGGVLAGAFGGMIATVVVMTVLRMLAKLVRRRTPAQPTVDTSPRLERIEQAIETIAVEVERISEAQRYSAKLLTERLPEATAPLPRRAVAPERVATPH
jgi:hypothetical protein